MQIMLILIKQIILKSWKSSKPNWAEMICRWTTFKIMCNNPRWLR